MGSFWEIASSTPADHPIDTFIDDLELTYRQANQTVSRMTKVAVVEPRITGEESHRSDMMQERDDHIVLYPLSADFVTNLANPDPPATQELPLAVW